jgi:hypothetical protein
MKNIRIYLYVGVQVPSRKENISIHIDEDMDGWMDGWDVRNLILRVPALVACSLMGKVNGMESGCCSCWSGSYFAGERQIIWIREKEFGSMRFQLFCSIFGLEWSGEYL